MVGEAKLVIQLSSAEVRKMCVQRKLPLLSFSSELLRQQAVIRTAAHAGNAGNDLITSVVILSLKSPLSRLLALFKTLKVAFMHNEIAYPCRLPKERERYKRY